MIDFLSHYAPQIIATQEGLINQITFLNKNLLNYQYVGIGRDNGKTKGEFCAIFYDTTELELLNQETFWLSKTPEIVSVGWDASMERICTYAKFKHKSNNKKFWVFNTHFDHLGKRARKKSAKLILKMIAENNTENHPVVLMGDLNAYPTSKAIKIIADYFGDPLNETQLIGDESTFNDFGRTNTSKRIDYMFFKGWKIKSYHHLSNHWNNKTFLSDHKAVFAELSF
jgi:endonuclease/exonuclease/phosphatase family metal-dependent hydrolase